MKTFLVRVVRTTTYRVPASSEGEALDRLVSGNANTQEAVLSQVHSQSVREQS